MVLSINKSFLEVLTDGCRCLVAINEEVIYRCDVSISNDILCIQYV